MPARGFIDPAFAAKAGLGHRIGDAGTLGQGGGEAAAAHALGIGARGDAGDLLEQAQEMVAGIAGVVGQCLQRGDGFGGFDHAHGGFHARALHGGALALGVAAFAGTEAGGFGGGGIGVEAGIAAQRWA